MRTTTRTACASAVVLAGLALAAPAAAQHAIPRPAGQAAWARAAYDHGYREGWEYGERDARQRRTSDYAHAREYQRANRGYDRRYGSLVDYRRLFRDGYAAGYAEACAAYAPRGHVSRPYLPPASYPGPTWGRAPTSGDPALERGYADGYEKGFDAGRDRDRFDVLRHKWYRSADRGYGRWYGSRDRYRDAYREGFHSGYARGYRDGMASRDTGWRARGLFGWRW